MQNKEIEKLLSCDNCLFYACEGCEITWTDKKKIREYIEQLENKIKEETERNKKLIKKLEEDIENSDKGLDTNILLIKEYYKNKKEYAEEILSIAK